MIDLFFFLSAKWIKSQSNQSSLFEISQNIFRTQCCTSVTATIKCSHFRPFSFFVIRCVHQTESFFITSSSFYEYPKQRIHNTNWPHKMKSIFLGNHFCYKHLYSRWDWHNKWFTMDWLSLCPKHTICRRNFTESRAVLYKFIYNNLASSIVYYTRK